MVSRSITLKHDLSYMVWPLSSFTAIDEAAVTMPSVYSISITVWFHALREGSNVRNGGDGEVQLYALLTSALDEVSGQFHVPSAFNLGKDTSICLKYEARWAQYQPGRFADKKNTSHMSEKEAQFTGRPARSAVAVPPAPHVFNLRSAFH